MAAGDEVKLCPGCGRPNRPRRQGCWKCGADLSGVAQASAWGAAVAGRPAPISEAALDYVAAVLADTNASANGLKALAELVGLADQEGAARPRGVPPPPTDGDWLQRAASAGATLGAAGGRLRALSPVPPECQGALHDGVSRLGELYGGIALLAPRLRQEGGRRDSSEVASLLGEAARAHQAVTAAIEALGTLYSGSPGSSGHGTEPARS